MKSAVLSFLPALLLLAAIGPLSAAGGGRRDLTFVVRAGERVIDLADRWQAAGVSSRAAVAAVAAREPFARFPLVPPPRPEASRFEGLFSPGRYTVALPQRRPGESEQSHDYRVTAALVGALLARGPAASSRVPPVRGLSAYQVLILASIVEKEAAGGRDYATVAAVFFNRLAEGMDLGSCPTLEYALGYHRPFLTAGDVRVDSPYNTYRHLGLPPTPIAFASRAALEAVQHPADTDALFFVFDWTTGRLLFARSFAEHQRQSRRAEARYAALHGWAALHRKAPGVFYRD